MTIEGYIRISTCVFCKEEISEAIDKGLDLQLVREGNNLHLECKHKEE